MAHFLTVEDSLQLAAGSFNLPKGELGTQNSQPETSFVNWVMGFGRHAEVLEPAHLRQALAEELAATAQKYAERGEPAYQEI